MWKIKTFEELTKRELYEILKLRSEVFVVEQGGRYQDLDGIDLYSVHIFCQEESGEVTGCLRVFPKEDEPGTVQLGRLVVKNRMHGTGRKLMEEGARIAQERYGAKKLYLTGRESAYGFYRKCGYHADGPKITEGKGGYYILRKTLETVPSGENIRQN